MLRSAAGNLGKWFFLKGVTYEDWIDRLNYPWTFLLLVILAIVSSWCRYSYPPMQCWTPREFTGSMIQYSNDQCWMSRTYYLPMDETIPVDMQSNRQQQEVPIYHWIPILLALQALCFKIPHIIWRLLHGLSGVSFAKLSGLTDGSQRLTTAERNITARQIARYLDRWLKSALIPGIPWRFLTILYFFAKLLFCINVTLQLSYIDSLLKADNMTTFGEQMANNLYRREEFVWNETSNLPKVILCDLEVRMLTNVQRYTLQCVVPINLFYEQIYLVLWMWLLVVAVLTWFSLVVNVIIAILPMIRTSVLQAYLDISDESASWGQAPSLGSFGNYVGHDGVMVLDAIGQNSSEFMVRDVVVHLWRIKTGVPNVQPREPMGQLSPGYPPGQSYPGYPATQPHPGVASPDQTMPTTAPYQSHGAPVPPPLYPSARTETIPLVGVKGHK